MNEHSTHLCHARAYHSHQGDKRPERQSNRRHSHFWQLMSNLSALENATVLKDIDKDGFRTDIYTLLVLFPLLASRQGPVRNAAKRSQTCRNNFIMVEHCHNRMHSLIIPTRQAWPNDAMCAGICTEPVEKARTRPYICKYVFALILTVFIAFLKDAYAQKCNHHRHIHLWPPDGGMFGDKRCLATLAHISVESITRRTIRQPPIRSPMGVTPLARAGGGPGSRGPAAGQNLATGVVWCARRFQAKCGPQALVHAMMAPNGSPTYTGSITHNQ